MWRGRRPETRKNYEKALDLFESICRPRQLRAINERTLSAFVAGMRTARKRDGTVGLSPITVRVYLQFLRTALGWAVAQGLLPKTPKSPAVKVPKKKPLPVPVESFERLLLKSEDDPPMKAYLLCGWLAGLRRNEALALEWEETVEAPWVDFIRERIWLPAEFVKAAEDQWVPLDPDLREALLDLPRRGHKVFNFVSRTGRPLSETGLCHRISSLAKKAGVKLTMKTLRKGFGCRYAGRVPSQVLQKLMRHADISTTMNYYANVDQAVEDAVLGDRRNSLRNRAQSAAERAERGIDANPSEDK